MSWSRLPLGRRWANEHTITIIMTGMVSNITFAPSASGRLPGGSEAASGADHPCVEAGQVKAPGETGVFDLQAAVHDHRQPGALRDPGGIVAPEPELGPEGMAARSHRLLGDSREILGPAEDVHQIRNGREGGDRGVDAPAEDLGLPGIDEPHV